MSTRRLRQRFLGPRSILLSLFFLACVSHPALAQSEPATAQVVDSAGTVVGPVLDHYSRTGASVALLIDGHSTILLFRTDSFDTIAVTGELGVFFASADCTGQGYAVNYGPFEFFEPQAVGGPNRTFYAGTRSAVFPGPFNFQSALFSGQACAAQSGTLPNALPVFPVRDLSPTWQPPFRIENVRGATATVPAVSTLGLVGIAVALAIGGLFLLRRRQGMRFSSSR
jgi:hypothetical protein